MDKICFVISPIGTENSLIRERSDQIFEYVIRSATVECGYRAIGGDQIPQPGYITSQVIEHLLNDDLVIADLTGKNPNVFYELALRHSFKKPVIQIKDDTDEDPIPFDLLGLRTISVDFRFMKKMQKCKEEIVKQIKTLEDDPSSVESPISFIEQSRSLEKLLLDITDLKQEIDKLQNQGTNENKQIKELKLDHDNKIQELASHLPETNVARGATERAKILWVDDHPINNEGIIDVYQHQGVDFDLAINTSQALHYLSINKYDLIISDMGRGSVRDEGVNMIKSIKQSVANPPPIYIFCSRIANEIYGKQAIEEGAVMVTSSPKELILSIVKTVKIK